MEQISNLLQNFELNKTSSFLNRRDELIKKAVVHINQLRASQNWRFIDKQGKVGRLSKESPANLAKRINMNPFLAGKEKDGELEYILNHGRENNNYWLLYKTLNNKK